MKTYKTFKPSVSARPPAQSLTDQRYQDLLKVASAFFSNEEQRRQALRQEAIEDIKALMQRYGLTAQDLAG
ncbi:MAG: hypothetical protein RLZZ352_1719 [Pseudomonadota bacterium]|jgi:antitoxin component HigA of HigAB toxin-antitoxin module